VTQDSLTPTLSKTPLWKNHVDLGAKMVEFAGWSMPIQYEGLRQEHLHVRNSVGIFDVSHMGEIWFRGPLALESLQWLTTNNVALLESGQAQYNLLLNKTGGIVDDIIIYCIEKNLNYLVCVNAANRQKDFNWMVENNKGAEIKDESNQWAQIAIQGAKAWSVCRDIFSELPVEFKPFSVYTVKTQSGKKAIFATTGYTGEIGGEVFIPAEEAVWLWNKCLSFKEVKPIGLGARDTLRTEMKYSLYGHEIDDTTNPFEAGLGWVFKPQAKDFIGKEEALKSKEKNTRDLVAIKTLDAGIPRPDYNVVDSQGLVLGRVVSGTHSPLLDGGIAIAYVSKNQAGIGQELFIDIRGRKVKSKVVKAPFVSSSLTQLLKK
jgi:aminomethyltransferase